MNYPQGSLWHKWDLHVHTPESVYQCYPGEKAAQWEQFLKNLAALPPEFKVIGINDYIFLEGYRKVLEAKEAGNLPNLDLILPVIELRLDRFGGTDKHFSRVNCHVLFSDEVTPDLIESQFLNALKSKYQLSPEATGASITWQAVPTRESLSDLGQMIIDSIPVDKRNGNPSPLNLGFNNINFSMDAVRDSLTNNYLEGRCLIAIGKVEWADIKWTDQLIAEKKTIINSADMVFTAAESPGACIRGREKLKSEGVNSALFDCSDAHSFSTSGLPNRIGNCFTWIKADTSFEGLKQSLREYDCRVFIGDEPPKFSVVRAEGGRFLRSIAVRKKDGSSLSEDWFDCQIPLHSDLVAIIGRKGSGKSALADIIGLLADSRREPEFSFLNSRRFRLPRENKAREFEAVLTFENGTFTTRSLDASVDTKSPQRVNYIPQNFFERLCGDLAKGIDTDFQKEIENVIFSRLGEAARLGQRSLQGVIDYRTEEIQAAAGILRDDLKATNKQIAEAERMLQPEYAEELQKKLAQRQQELKDHEGGVPEKVEQPATTPGSEASEDEGDELAAKTSVLADIESKIRNAQSRAVEVTRKLAAIVKIESSITNTKDRHRREGGAVSDELLLMGLVWDDLAKLVVDEEPLKQAQVRLEADKVEVGKLLADEGDGSLMVQLASCNEEIGQIRDKLNEPQRKYQAYLETIRAWEKKKLEIVGAEGIPGSIADLEAMLERLTSLPEQLGELEAKRRELARGIYDRTGEIVELYRDLYRPVQRIVDSNTTVQEKLGLAFNVSVKNEAFEKGFLTRIRRNVKGTFSGPDGPTVLKAIVEETDFDEKESTLTFLNRISANLHHDHGNPTGEEFLVANQLREKVDPEDLYSYVFGMKYLQPQYTLAMKDKPLDSLSPGERGALLLIFYLLVDDDNIPVILDQPDENLDNETVYDLLVPCIQEAKRHRQVIIVTHNPNIAVVCDADQVIHASIDKSNGCRVTYVTGAIENPEMNKHLIDVLEGTRPAFTIRNDKYLE